MVLITANLVPFFIVHYGCFCYGHVTFVIGLFGCGSSLNPRVGAALAELRQGPFRIVGKILIDMHLHDKERRKLAAAQQDLSF